MRYLIKMLSACWKCSCGCPGCGRGNHCGVAGNGCVWDNDNFVETK